MEQVRSIAAVLAAYPLGEVRATPLGSAGGFSGAEFWKLESAGETFCLRRWPREHPSIDRLRYIHGVLKHVFGHGVRQLALPLPTRSNATFVAHDGSLWELSPWMPGTADYHSRPSSTRLRAAMRMLAGFHVAAATFGSGPRTVEASPGVLQRLELVDQLIASDARRIARAVEADIDPTRQACARGILEAFIGLTPTIRPALVAAARCPVQLQPCLRDIWHDHVLFSEDEVTGLVDFGALREECVAADVARLLGSLVLGDEDAWRVGLDSYQQLRPLSTFELRLLDVFQQTNALLSGMNWLRWIYLDGRRFEEPSRVLTRMNENLDSLHRLQKRVSEAVWDNAEA